MPAGFPPLPSVTVETGSGAALLVSDPAARGISLAIAHSASPWRPLLPDSDDPALTDVSALVASLQNGQTNLTLSPSNASFSKPTQFGWYHSHSSSHCTYLRLSFWRLQMQ